MPRIEHGLNTDWKDELVGDAEGGGTGVVMGRVGLPGGG